MSRTAIRNHFSRTLFMSTKEILAELCQLTQLPEEEVLSSITPSNGKAEPEQADLARELAWKRAN